MDKLEVGTRIRVLKGQAPFFNAGDEGSVHHYDMDGDMWVEFDRKYRNGIWCVSQSSDCDFEVISPAPELTHAEYFHKYGKLTEERIRDLLAVYEEAKGKESAVRQELIDSVRC